MSEGFSLKSKGVRALHLLAIGWMIFLPFPHFSHGQQDISIYKQRLEKIEADKERLQKQIKSLEKRTSSLLAQLDKIGLEKKVIQKEITQYNLQLQRASEELRAIQEQIPTLKEKLDREKEAVSQILVTLYKFGDMSYLDFLFRAEDVFDLMSESKHLTLLAQYQEKVVLSFLQTLNELRQAEATAETKKQEVADYIAQTRQKNRDLEAQEKKNRAFILQIGQDRETHLQALEELEARAAQLQKLIDRLIQEKVSLPFTVIPLYENKGSLLWPVSGTIITPFGIERHPQFKTETQNNGIEIATEENSVIKAIHPGKVVYADYFQGFYGNLIIIDHGLSYYSMYGHCSEFRVQKGDIVEAGQAIATVGDTGSLKGAALYFQINLKTDPQDPLQWLKRR